MKKIELLAPAGDKERCFFAIEYGADAVFLGAKQYSLRARASNFDISDIDEVVKYAHMRNKKIYLVCNVICHNFLAKGFLDFFKKISTLKIDGFICADPYIIHTIGKYFPKCEIHISTQQSITNSYSAKFWKKYNVKRVILARELSLTEIEQTSNNLKGILEVEIFIHGAVCISYSGRCMMSNNFSLRDSNVGGCAQSCRWEYEILNTNSKNLFTMSAKDMSYVEYIQKLMNMNISSFKIEGRMKTVNYLSSIIKQYRILMDVISNNKKINIEEIRNSIKQVSNRETSTALLIRNDEKNMIYHDVKKQVLQNFVFNVIKKIDETHYEVITKNHLDIQKKLFVVFPNKINDVELQIKSLFNIEKNEYTKIINTPMTRAIIELSKPIELNQFCIGRIQNE